MSWEESDQQKVLAWSVERLSACRKCGTREEEWDPHRGGERNAYIPQVYVCPGCKATEDAHKSALGDAKATKASTTGLHVRLLPREVFRALQAESRKKPK